MTSYLIDLQVLEYHAGSEITKVLDLKIMDMWTMVDLRAKIQD